MPIEGGRSLSLFPREQKIRAIARVGAEVSANAPIRDRAADGSTLSRGPGTEGAEAALPLAWGAAERAVTEGGCGTNYPRPAKIKQCRF